MEEEATASSHAFGHCVSTHLAFLPTSFLPEPRVTDPSSNTQRFPCWPHQEKPWTHGMTRQLGPMGPTAWRDLRISGQQGQRSDWQNEESGPPAPLQAPGVLAEGGRKGRCRRWRLWAGAGQALKGPLLPSFCSFPFPSICSQSSPQLTLQGPCRPATRPSVLLSHFQGAPQGIFCLPHVSSC